MIKMVVAILLLTVATSVAVAQSQQAGSAAAQSQPASTPAAPPSVELPAELARVLSDYEAGWQGGDAAALAHLFVEDGFALSPGRPPVRGRAEIEQHYKGKSGGLSLRALAYATEGSLGYIIGAYSEKKGEPDIGKFTLVLRKAGGRWLIVSDMDNPSRPMRRP
jgi:ketosteroid isomerase-like protein